jgi:hypothetical protein
VRRRVLGLDDADALAARGAPRWPGVNRRSSLTRGPPGLPAGGVPARRACRRHPGRRAGRAWRSTRDG